MNNQAMYMIVAIILIFIGLVIGVMFEKSIMTTTFGLAFMIGGGFFYRKSMSERQ